jgi:lambda family phage portal protein
MTELLQNGRLSELMNGNSDFMRSATDIVTTQAAPKAEKRNYLAAASGRLTTDWPTVNMSSDEELYRDLRKLRGRSRWLKKNNGYYAKYINMCCDNIVGPKGVRLEAKVLSGNTTNLDKIANIKIEDAWKAWGKKGVCSVGAGWSLFDMERVIIRSVAKDGEVIIRKWYGTKNGWGYALELIDAMRLPVEFNKILSATSEIINGIEYESGQVIAYWLLPANMKYDFSTNQAERIEAQYIIHMYFPEDAGQKRGVPWLVAGMGRMKMQDGYENAEVVQARIAAEAGGYFTKTAAAEAGFSGADDDEEETIENIESEAGNFRILPEGWNFTQFDPTHPTTAFADFNAALLRGIASSGNVNYTSLANTPGDANYSSLRIAVLEGRDNWQIKQKWFIEWFHEQIYADWLAMAMSSGKLNGLRFAEIERYKRVTFVPRFWVWVDPQKEAEGNKAKVAMGTASLTDIAAEQGKDFEDVIEQQKKEKDLLIEAGLYSPEIFGLPAPAPAPAVGTDANIARRLDELERRLAGYKINGIHKELDHAN